MVARPGQTSWKVNPSLLRMPIGGTQTKARTNKVSSRPLEWNCCRLTRDSKKGHLLVVVDYYSKWPEIAFLTKTDAGNVIKCMKSMFPTHGLPETLRSDNGPPFALWEFQGFLEYLLIDHKKGITYWPQSDGEVERLKKTLPKAIRIAQLQCKDWKREIQDFLFQYRGTPHTVTSLSPAELLMGRKLRDTVSCRRLNLLMIRLQTQSGKFFSEKGMLTGS